MPLSFLFLFFSLPPAICMACSLTFRPLLKSPLISEASLTTLISSDTHPHPSLPYSALCFSSHHLINYTSAGKRGTCLPSCCLYEAGQEVAYLSLFVRRGGRKAKTLSIPLNSCSPWLSSTNFHSSVLSYRSWTWEFHRYWADLSSFTQSAMDVSGTLFRTWGQLSLIILSFGTSAQI